MHIALHWQFAWPQWWCAGDRAAASTQAVCHGCDFRSVHKGCCHAASLASLHHKTAGSNTNCRKGAFLRLLGSRSLAATTGDWLPRMVSHRCSLEICRLCMAGVLLHLSFGMGVGSVQRACIGCHAGISSTAYATVPQLNAFDVPGHLGTAFLCVWSSQWHRMLLRFVCTHTHTLCRWLLGGKPCCALLGNNLLGPCSFLPGKFWRPVSGLFFECCPVLVLVALRCCNGF